MLTKLPDEIRQAIQQSSSEVRLQDDQTHAVYVVVDEATHRRAMKALKAQEDWESVQRGLADRAQRNELPLAEADAQMRKELGFPPRT
jgi:hypothetical protein